MYNTTMTTELRDNEGKRWEVYLCADATGRTLLVRLPLSSAGANPIEDIGLEVVENQTSDYNDLHLTGERLIGSWADAEEDTVTLAEVLMTDAVLHK